MNPMQSPNTGVGRKLSGTRLLNRTEYPRFKVGDRVLITRYSLEWNGKMGFITEINGEYHYVRPRWYKHEIELYRCEIEKA